MTNTPGNQQSNEHLQHDTDRDDVEVEQERERGRENGEDGEPQHEQETQEPAQQYDERRGRTIRDDEVPGFKEAVARARREWQEGQRPKPDIAKDLFFAGWFNVEDAVKEKFDKTKRWLDEKLTADALDTLIERYYGQYVRGDEFAWERTMTGLLLKKVEEIKSNKAMSSSDRIRKFEYYVKVKNEFESRAYLLAMAVSGDFTEQHMETYLKRFGKFVKDAPVYNGNEPAVDAHGKPITTSGYIGNIRDQWFEDLARKYCHLEGKVPGMWHSGPRQAIRSKKDGRIIGVGFKSAEERARGADSDLLELSGQRIDIPMDTYLNHLQIRDEGQAKATEELLKRKIYIDPERQIKSDPENGQWCEIDLLINSFQEDQTRERIKLSDPNTSTDDKEKARKQISLLDHKISVEEERKIAIEHRLAYGIAKGDVRSLLLDPTSNDTVMVDGKEYAEKDLAMGIGIRKYYQSRSENDVARLVRGYGVKLHERLAFNELTSEKHREEFALSCKHYMLGVRWNGKYDKTRDAAVNISELIVSNPERVESQNFSENAMRFKIVRERGEKRLVAYDDDGTPHILERSMIDPEDPIALQNFHIHKPWEGQDEHYQKICDAPTYQEVRRHRAPVDGASDFTACLMRGIDKVNDYLKRDGVLSSVDVLELLNRSRSELKELRRTCADALPIPHWEEGGQTIQATDEFCAPIKNYIRGQLPADASIPLKEISREQQEECIATMNLPAHQAEAVRNAFWAFNEGTIRELIRAEKCIPELEKAVHDATEITRIERERVPDESDIHLRTRLNARRGQLNKFSRDIPLEMVDDTTALPTTRQKERLNLLNLSAAVPIEIGDRRLYEILQDVESQEMALGYALFRLGHTGNGKQRRQRQDEDWMDEEEEELGGMVR